MLTDPKVPTPTGGPAVATASDAVAVPPPSTGFADFFSASEARADRWRQLLAVARAWQSSATHGKPDDTLFGDVVSLFGEVAPLEAFFAYPGPRLMAAIEQSLAEHNPGSCVRLVQLVSSSILTGAYRHDMAAWDAVPEETASRNA